MNELNFDLKRFIEPKSLQDFEAILDEALAMADDVQTGLDDLLRDVG